MKPVISSVGEKVVDKIQSINLKVSKQHLIKKNWVLLKESEEERQIYIFQKDQTLLIANSGDVIKGKWEEVGDNSLMIEFDNKSTLYQPSYESESIFILKVNGKEQYLYLVEEKLYEEGYRSVEMVMGLITAHNKNSETPQTLYAITSIEEQKEQNRRVIFYYIIFLIIVLIIVALTSLNQ